MKRTQQFAVNDKVVLTSPVKCWEDFTPCPVMGKVYCVREVVDCSDGVGLRLVGIQGDETHGDESTLAAEKFRLVGNPAARRTIPILNVKMMSDQRWNQLATMQEDAVALIKEGKQAEAFTRLCDTLQHDCPIRWLLSCRRRAAAS